MTERLPLRVFSKIRRRMASRQAKRRLLPLTRPEYWPSTRQAVTIRTSLTVVRAAPVLEELERANGNQGGQAR